MDILLAFTELNQKFGALRSQHGLASISAVLKKAGHRVSLCHFDTVLDLDYWRQRMAATQPGLIGFYSTAEQFHFVVQLIRAVPDGIFTILGGPHATCYPTCLEAVPRLDALCIGEGEYPMLELAEAHQSGRDPTRIRNLWVRQKGGIIRNETRPFMENLDELPFEDRDLFNTQEAIDRYGMAQVRIMASRGCPYNCSYCSNKKMSGTQPGRYVRFRSAEHILDELNAIRERFKFDEVYFDDDIFMTNRNLVDAFCARYPKEIGKPFLFCGRVEMCRREVLQSLKKAGGRRIDFGVESGNEELRRTVLNRRMTNEDILEATNMAKSVGLQVKTYNMVGLPEETVEKHMDTVRLNQAINPDVAGISVFFPYPGTEAYDRCLQKGYLHPDESLPENYVSRRQSILEMPDFPKEKIAQCFKRFGFRVYWKHAPLKAIGYSLIYSKRGEFVLTQTRKFRKLLRKIVTGF